MAISMGEQPQSIELSDKPVKVDHRPWGNFIQFNQNTECTVKIINVAAGKRLSLQYHNKRQEHWFILSGRAKITISGKESEAGPGDSFVVPVGARHRIEGITDTAILEMAKGVFDEADIVRIEDDFGRK